MKKTAVCLVLAVMFIAFSAAGVFAETAAEEKTGETVFSYRFASAEEGAELLLANREYYENLNQRDLDFRLQKTGATLEELEAFIPAQMLDFTDEEKNAVGRAMDAIEEKCAARGYRLPATAGIVFVKTTMAEECGADAYTHGTEIYLGEELLGDALSDNEDFAECFLGTVAHELFHCLTRSHPDFRASMYGILGFTVQQEDFDFAPEIRERMISNPDVEHHNSCAAFEIGGKMRNCTVIFTGREPFRREGDTFFGDNMQTGLVPVDELNVMYDSEEAANFWDVFGRNTEYVIDPEETMADNFGDTVIYGPEGRQYQSPEIIAAIDAYLKGN